MNLKHTHSSCSCGCCRAAQLALTTPPAAGVTRRQFLYGVGTFAASSLAAPSLLARTIAEGPQRRPLEKRPLRVQPVLTYEIPQRHKATSWRSWGGLQTQAQVDEEKARISQELSRLADKAEFPLEMRPLVAVRTMEQAKAIDKSTYDTLLVYAAGGGGNLLETMVTADKWNLMFLRHDSGPAYLWYEIVHPRFLRKTVDDYGQPGMGVEDVVVDSYDEVLMKLRALHGLKASLNKRIVAVGGPGGWGAGGRQAPQIARDQWKMELINYPYAELAPQLKKARQDKALVERCAAQASAYLKQRGVSLQTTREFVQNAFVLREVFKDVMEANNTDAITINSCMGTIMPMSETTACLPLSLLNDEGYLAFCESDFVVIPSGILLHYISGKPVFLNDPTTPHDGVVTLAHCTAPRKMDGKRLEKVKILTHFESDYGAAPKVEMKIGQACTNLVPDFASKKWVGFDATIIANPFFDICRSQIDVRVKGDCNALLEEMKGFHWMMSYGSYLPETGYALKKIGVEMHNVSAPKIA